MNIIKDTAIKLTTDKDFGPKVAGWCILAIVVYLFIKQ